MFIKLDNLKIIFFVFFMLPKLGFAEELVCSCISFNSSSTHTEGSKVETFAQNNCPKKDHKILLDYDDGFMSITFKNNNKSYDLDIAKDEEKYIKGEYFKDKKNFMKVHFNKKNYTLRISRTSYVSTKPIFIPKLDIYNEGLIINSKYKLKLKCV